MLVGFLTGVGNQLSPVKSQTCWGETDSRNTERGAWNCQRVVPSSMLTVEGSVSPAAPIAARPRQLRVGTWRDSNALSATVVDLRLPARKFVESAAQTRLLASLNQRVGGFNSIAAHPKFVL